MGLMHVHAISLRSIGSAAEERLDLTRHLDGLPDSQHLRKPRSQFFCQFRKLVGTNRVEDNKQLQRISASWYPSASVSFVDTTAIETKKTTWEERDKALREGEEKLNNQNIKKYSADKQARYRCKGKSKFWYGYKGHASVDMGSGLIDRIAGTPANVTDQDGFKHICPGNGEMTFGDKSYGLKPAQTEMAKHGAKSAAILKNNMSSRTRFRSVNIRRHRLKVFS